MASHDVQQMGGRPKYREPQIEHRPQPTTVPGWIAELVALAPYMTTVDAACAAFDVADWRISTRVIETTRRFSGGNAERLQQTWTGAVSPPQGIAWLAMYLAVQIQLGRLPADQAVLVMTEVVQRHGGKVAPVNLDDPHAVDEEGYSPDYRGRA